MNESEVREKVRTFILSNFYVADPSVLKDDMSLLEAGIVDSTGVLEVITFLEGEFDMSVADQEMVPNNLDAVNHITKYVLSKK